MAFGFDSVYDKTLQNFALQTKGARFEDGGVLAHGKACVPCGNNEIIFDAIRATRYLFHSRVRANFHNPRRFQFSLKRKLSENFLDDLKKATGLQVMTPLPIHHPGWPPNLVLRASDAARAQQIFADARIRQCAAAQPTMQLDIRAHSPLEAAKGAPSHTLHFRTEEWICDTRRLQTIHVLFHDLLQHLTQ